MDTAHQTAESHVDASSEQRRCDKDEETLYDVGDELVGFVLGGSAGGIADDFNCGGVLAETLHVDGEIETYSSRQ